MEQKEVPNLIKQIKEEKEYKINNMDLSKKEKKEQKKTIEKELSKIFRINLLSNTMKNNLVESKEYVEKRTNANKYYQKNLVNTDLLAKELHLSNSLEYSLLHTYLLWNGYYSKDKDLVFNGSDRKLITGLFSYDIMAGKGVYLNFSYMLTELLNQSGYQAATLINSVDKKTKLEYDRKIKRKKKKDNIYFRSFGKFMEPISNKIGNHAFNLIKGNEKLYIYDSTNICLLNIKNKEQAQIVEGKGTYKLNIDFSYCLNTDDKSIELLDSLLLPENQYRHFNEFSPILYQHIELFDQNKSLLNDYYATIEPSIDEITNVLKNAKTLKKEMYKQMKSN